MKRLVVAAVMALAMGSGASAFAQGSPDGARPVPVRYADLNLARQDDAAMLLDRLRLATARACAVQEIARPNAATLRSIEACRSQALAEAVARLNAPMVTQLYAADQTVVVDVQPR